MTTFKSLPLLKKDTNHTGFFLVGSSVILEYTSVFSLKQGWLQCKQPVQVSPTQIFKKIITSKL